MSSAVGSWVSLFRALHNCTSTPGNGEVFHGALHPEARNGQGFVDSEAAEHKTEVRDFDKSTAGYQALL